MLFRGGRKTSASESTPTVRSPSRVLGARKIAQPSEPIQQVQEPEQEEDREPEEDREVVVARIPQRPRPQPPAPRIPSRPQPTEDEAHEPAPEPYSFSYSVDDPESGAATSREESQDINGEVRGFYEITDRDGRKRKVEYTAGKDGFKANIVSNEEGLNGRAPADVSIDHSPSPSETVLTYAPNNRPITYGRPPQGRFFQKFTPALPSAAFPKPAFPAPTQSPVASASDRVEQTPDDSQISQRIEQSPEDSKISQTYESEPSEVIQQKSVDDEELPLQSAPVKGGPSLLPPPQQSWNTQRVVDSAWIRPINRPVGTYNPILTQTYHSAQGPLSFQPITQIRGEIPNSIQEVQRNEVSAPSAPAQIKSIPRTWNNKFQPLSPILGSANIRVNAFEPKFTQQFANFYPRIAPQPQPVHNFVSYNPPLNNLIYQTPQQYFDYIQPQITYNPLPTGPGISLVPSRDTSYIPQQPNRGYSVVVQHRDNQQILSAPKQETREISQEKGNDFPDQQFTESRVTEPPAQQTVQYPPLPSISQFLSLQRQQSFEPQSYEPADQQTYESFAQREEDPAEESRAPQAPRCDYNDKSETRIEQVKGEPSAVDPVKSESSAPVAAKGRLSPARTISSFLPQAFRT